EILISERAGKPPKRAIRYLHHDRIGSVEAVTSESADVLEVLAFDPHGNRVDLTDPTARVEPSGAGVHVGFAGHEHDDETGLVDMRARLYDPRLARFLTPDPAGANPFRGGSLNRYAYASNDPVNRVDPTGLEDVPVAGGGTVAGPGSGDGGGFELPAEWFK